MFSFTHSTDAKQAELVTLLRSIEAQARCNGSQLSQLQTHIQTLTAQLAAITGAATIYKANPHEED